MVSKSWKIAIVGVSPAMAFMLDNKNDVYVSADLLIADKQIVFIYNKLDSGYTKLFKLM